jgi:hypothetical protein
MKKVVAIVLLGSLLLALAPLTVHAHGAAAAALALGAFATFSVLTAPFWAYPAYAYPYRPYYPAAPYYYSAPYAYSAPATYVSAPVAAAPQTPAIQREVVYPHGRHVLYGDGVTTPYQWVWVPNAPPPPPR